MSDDQKIIVDLLKEIKQLRQEKDDLTPKLFRIKSWVETKNGPLYIINTRHKCYKKSQADAHLDTLTARSGGRFNKSIITSVEKVDFDIIEDDWINQLAKKLL